jgi:hypothetical protein
MGMGMGIGMNAAMSPTSSSLTLTPAQSIDVHDIRSLARARLLAVAGVTLGDEAVLVMGTAGGCVVRMGVTMNRYGDFVS